MYSRAVILVLAVFSVATALPLPDLTPVAVDQDLLESPRPYNFGFEFGDGLGMVQHRSESADGNGLVKGSYGYYDADGLYRKVEYTADSDGYRAIIRSNEPGLSSQNSADATFIVESPPPAVLEKQILSSPEPFLPEI